MTKRKYFHISASIVRVNEPASELANETSEFRLHYVWVVWLIWDILKRCVRYRIYRIWCAKNKNYKSPDNLPTSVILMRQARKRNGLSTTNTIFVDLVVCIFQFGFVEINWSIYNTIYVLTKPIYFNLKECENKTTEQSGVNSESEIVTREHTAEA